ncbi:MAG: hypothetical protein BMS9Abin33_0140 [Gammaproteobacteria bacterium]|nr:MAG: hypothetical protein BMS9Abin33_0140 [Gammaproteobacteria bacterium]
MSDNSEQEWNKLLDEVTATINLFEGTSDNPVTGDNAWLDGLKGSPTFSGLSAEKLAAMIMKLEEYPVKAGDVIVRQNDEGDYYFIIKSGKFTVSRRTAPGEIEILAVLEEGDAFGEESLVSNNKRNASIVADNDGLLMRLSKENFDEILKRSLVKYLTLSETRELVKQGAKVLDVRLNTPDKKGGIKDAHDFPLDQLRDRLSELDSDAQYVIYCQTGNQSETAAFLLTERGYNVAVLKGGLLSIAGS